ncbi:MAG: UDP-N-acetylmuramoyl-L-alanine--D-glutamate ligase [Erysipelotrichaceae bacterium]
MKFKDKKVLVIGGARSGVAVSKLLKNEGATVCLNDASTIENKEELLHLGIEVLEAGHPDFLKNTEWDFVVKNPGIPYHVPFVKWFEDHSIKIYTEIEIAYCCAPRFHYGAITGTNGKTTITSILYALLQKNHRALVAGNIGCPLSELASQYGDEEKDVALELSNFQLLGIDTFHPEIAVICNLAPDHLDYMGNVEAYYQSKVKIAQNQTKDDWFLRNVDDEIVMQYTKDIKATMIDYSLIKEDVDLCIQDGWATLRGLRLFEVASLKIVGSHNLSNAMIAACMAYKLGVSIQNIQEGIAEFEAIEHRLEFCGNRDGVTYYNDSKATNTDAVVTALKAFDKNIILLAGGHDKGISFEPLKAFDQRVKCCVAFGETKEKFQTIFSRSHICEDMKEAFDYANLIAEKGDVILLSPACSSYDQFDNYEQRGEIFKEYVKDYIK